MSNACNEWVKTGQTQSGNDDPIAIVGIAVDLPGAPTANHFWRNLRDGIESIEPLDEEALLAAGETPERLRHKDYVASAARMVAFDEFDAEFFGFSAKEAAILDPQHRKFMEVSWGALENAGHMPERFKGDIGVYAGCGMGSYFYFNICSNPGLVDDVGMFLLRHTGNDKDFLATRVSHILDLKGPSINIQTACSTSLAAVHYACNALRQGDCDMALAGGVTIELPHGRGYVFKENEILSPDGHCHAFDHRARGTVFGSGAGCVALRRLSDAQADGDHIWAVIRGSAVNNDGADKASYLAPSVDGQAAAVTQALATADVAPETVDYVECHGTGTYLGDPIEVSALTEAFRKGTESTGYCRIGSVKTNIGHLDTAAGVASLTKASLALHHKQMPPSLGYEAPNPAIDFETSPFKVNDSLRDWDGRGSPRRAGVNSLGVGGTNAHAILEEAPERGASEQSDWPFHVLCLSGRSKAAVEGNCKALAAHLRANPDVDLADVAWTLKEGRRGFDKRRVLVAETALEAAELLEAGDTRRVFSHEVLGPSPEVIFMFPGGGAQYVDMARDLYETEPVFAEWLDRGLDHLQTQLDYDIRALWMPEADAAGAAEAARKRLKQPSAQLPLIMIVEYALAQLWMSWDVKPTALVGHSMGENTAACLAGVMAFEDCIDLVLLRGRLFDRVPKGGMLSISLPVAEIEALAGDDLDIASVNAPELSAVSGPDAALDALAGKLEAMGAEYSRVAIDIAAHSRMLDPILEEFRGFLAGLELSAPKIPVMSNRTGAVLTPEEAMSPDYWTAQLRNRVEFAACVSTLAEKPGRVYLEVGPGKALSSLAQMCPEVAPGQVLSSLRHPDQDIADDAYFLGVIGRLWACGVAVDWSQIWGEAKRQRLPLPGYAFQRKRYFIEPGVASVSEVAPRALMRREDMADWGWRAKWVPGFAGSELVAEADLSVLPVQSWLLFMDDAGLAEAAAQRLEDAGHRVVRVVSGDATQALGPGRYSLAPEMGRTGYDSLFAMLEDAGERPERIGHFWLVTRGETFRPGSSFFDRNMEHGVFSLTHLAQVLGEQDLETPVHISVVTSGAEQLRDEALPYPEKSIVAASAGVIPREVPGLSIGVLDIDLPAPVEGKAGMFRKPEPVFEVPNSLVAQVLEEITATPGNWQAVARGGKRFEKSYAPVALQADGDTPVWRDGGTYLITGGFGGIGQTVARDLLQTHGANVVLLSRGGVPAREDWDGYLRLHASGDATAKRIRALQELEGLGGEVAALSGDIANAQDMARVKAEIEGRFGPVTGVVHAAGVIDDGPLLAKREADMDAVFGPKITGLRVLEGLFPDGSLEMMVLFASSSTATRPAGQVDYAAANEYLNAYAKSRRGDATRVVAVNWGVWADVGMAADAMAARTGETEEDWRTVAQPLLDEAEGGARFRTEFSADSHWVIDGHRTKTGDALMPGTGFIELMAEAMAARGQGAPFEIGELHFLRAFDVPEGQARSLEMRMDGPEVELRGACSVEGREGTVLNAQANLRDLPGAVSKWIDIAAVEKRCDMQRRAEAGGRLMAPQERHLEFGARWHVLREMAFGDAEGLARLALPDDCKGDLEAGYILHPGLLDPATGWAMELIPGYEGNHLWVPLSYGVVRVLRPLPAEVVSWVRLGTAQGDSASFDIALCDARGKVCVEIENFRMTRLDSAVGFGKPAPITPAEVEFSGGGPAMPLSAEEERLLHNIGQGIRPEDGAEALRRAMNTGLSQIVVSSLDLDAMIAQAEVSEVADSGESQSFERPDLDGDFLAPRNAIEEALAKQWEKLLGVSPVGVEDSFFDLGGHSLIAVRLFATIKKEFGVEFPISVLFDAPTIATIAARIEAQTGAVPDAEGEAVAAPAQAQSFTHLVALNKGDAARKPPLFIVAGMFGNVLNLRHLAQQLGEDQPVYGVQARGLIGDDAPHTRIEEAATDYLAEIRQVQPEGPYLFGGFSGGGITAYEMAQQVKAQGGEVALLCMLDTPLPLRPGLSRRDKALIKLAEVKRKGPGYFREWALNRLEWERRKRQAQSDDAQGFNNHKIEAAFRDAVAQYEVKPWDGPLLLFRPPLDRHWKVSGGNWVSAAREYVFADNQWAQWAPDVQVIEVPGDHDSMVLDPNVAALARYLATEIARVTDDRPKDADPSVWQTVAAAE
jgi:acyl transferase domain-containing protein/acyl carrier protein